MGRSISIPPLLPLAMEQLDWRCLNPWGSEKTVEVLRLQLFSSKFHLASLVTIRFACVAGSDRGRCIVTSQLAASMILAEF